MTDPAESTPSTGFIEPGSATPEAQDLLDRDQADLGYVMNLTRVWAHQPATKQALMDVIGMAGASLTLRQRGILVAAAASTLGDAYCSLAWGGKLAAEADATVAAAVLRGDDDGLDESERALASWARQLARDPNATTAADVDGLRSAGFDDAQIFAVTTFAALRIAFSTVNDALGVRPDHELLDRVPGAVVAEVTFGRPVAPPA